MALTAGGHEREGMTARTVSLADVAAGGLQLELDGQGHPLDPLVVLELDGQPDAALERAARSLASSLRGVVVGISDRPLPDSRAARLLVDELDVVLAPWAPYAAHAGSRLDLGALSAQVRRAPVAATTFTQLLRATRHVEVTSGLLVESLAYSTLLGGEEFRRWQGARQARPTATPTSPSVALTRDGRVLEIVLDRPERRNAFSAAMRDALLEALTVADLDPSVGEVVIRGRGPAFCSGGDLDEFGTAADLAVASLVRTTHSVARRMHDIGDRVRCVLHGPCVGAGIEVPSFAGKVEAAEGTWFQLPEISMGLIPGAGGTVGIPRRIGRWRTAYMTLTGARIGLGTALEWGLVDGLA